MDEKNRSNSSPLEGSNSEVQGKTHSLTREEDKERSRGRLVEEISHRHKEIILSTKPGNGIDDRIISAELYNSFNYSVLPQEKKQLGYSIGFTSANKAEGTTTAACNFAISMSLGSKRKTVLVDMNLSRPKLHDVFKTPISPGIVEALSGEEIYVTPSKIDNLFILPVGNVAGKRIGLAHVSTFNDVIQSLLREYELLVVDLPSLDTKEFPTAFCNQLNGLLVVVEIGNTRRRDIERVFRKVHSDQILGFVMNKVDDDKL
jgi:Mrp family chromosome partitioning ATPase